MKPDLTLLHYTSNRLDHVNPRFAQIVRDQIVKSAGGTYPIISISHEPMDFGENICIGERSRSHLGIYKSILIGARAATTPYVAMVEDDVLYDASSWTTHRPPLTRFSFNLNRWGLNCWVDPPWFGYRARAVLNQMLCPRELLIEAFEERFAKYPAPDKTPLHYFAEPGRYERLLGVKVREFEGYASPIPSIVFSHQAAYGFESVGERKSVGEFPRKTLSQWGSAEAMLALWTEGYREKGWNVSAPTLPTMPYRSTPEPT